MSEHLFDDAKVAFSNGSIHVDNNPRLTTKGKVLRDDAYAIKTVLGFLTLIGPLTTMSREITREELRYKELKVIKRCK